MDFGVLETEDLGTGTEGVGEDEEPLRDWPGLLGRGGRGFRRGPGDEWSPCAGLERAAPFRIPVLRLWGREEGLGVEGEVEELGHELKLTEGFSEFPPAFKIDRICEIQNANGESEVSPDLIKFDNLAFALCQKAGSLIRSGETSGNSEKSHRINFLTSFLSTEQPPPTRIPTTW